jgi:hypothetical protein
MFVVAVAARLTNGSIRSASLPALGADILCAWEDVVEAGYLTNLGRFIPRSEASSLKLTIKGEIPIVTIAPVLERRDRLDHDQRTTCFTWPVPRWLTSLMLSNRDIIASFGQPPSLLDLIFGFFCARLLWEALIGPSAALGKSIATVMKITIWLFGAMRTRICSTAQCGTFAFSFKQILATKSHPFHLEMIRCLESQSAARGHHRMSAR